MDVIIIIIIIIIIMNFNRQKKVGLQGRFESSRGVYSSYFAWDCFPDRRGSMRVTPIT